MAWKNLARLLGEIAPDSDDRGLFLSLHTGGQPSADNELNPREHSGYDRIKATLRIDLHGLSNTTQQWVGRLNSNNESCWGRTGFSNRGSTPWPAVRSAAIFAGPEAGVPGAAPSFIVADRVLPQPWTLGAGSNGYPTNELVDFGVAKPDTANDDVFFWTQNLDSVAGDFVEFLRMFLQNISTGNVFVSPPGAFPWTSPSIVQIFGDRREAPFGIAQCNIALNFANTLPALGTRISAGNPFPGRAFVPMFGLSSDKAAIENLQAITLNAPAPVSASDISGELFWSMSMSGLAEAFTPGSTVARQSNANVPLRRSITVMAGRIATDAPALASGEGVIPAGAIRIVM